MDIENIEMSPGQPRKVVTVEAMVSGLRGGTLSTATLSLSGWTHSTLAIRSARLVIGERLILLLRFCRYLKLSRYWKINLK